MVTPDLNWGTVLTHARRVVALRQVLLSVRVAADVFNVPSPPDLPVDDRAASLASMVRTRILSGAIPPALAGESTRFCLPLFESSSQRVRYLSGLYITPSEAEYKAVNLPAWLHFLYYPYRPVRLIWRHAIRRGRAVLT